MSIFSFVAFGLICLLIIENKIADGHPVSVELTENDGDNQNYEEDQINEAIPVNEPPAIEEDKQAEETKPDINLKTESDERNVKEETDREEEEDSENEENEESFGIQAVESGPKIRAKRQDVQSCQGPPLSVYDEDMKRYEGVFGGFPQDLGVKRVKRSYWY